MQDETECGQQVRSDEQLGGKRRTVTSRVIRTAPERIWLQVSNDAYDHQSEFPSDHDGITWCQDSVVLCEVEYVRADIALAALPPDWRNEKWAHRLAVALGIDA